MTVDEPRDRGELTRRTLLRNGLMTGVGTAVVGAGALSFGGRARADTPSSPISSAESSTAAPLQLGWVYCNQCYGIFYTNNASWGVCPAGGDFGNIPHAFANNYSSFDYGLYYDAASGQTNWQPNWWWCHQCQGLFHSGSPNPLSESGNGVCPNGSYLDSTSNFFFNPHSNAGSYPYILYYGPASTGRQQAWRYCFKCYGLFFLPSGTLNGVCPSGGGNNSILHELYISYNYGVDHVLPNLTVGPSEAP